MMRRSSLLGIFLFLAAGFFLPTTAEAQWMAGWCQRRPLSVVEQNGSNLANYQVRIDITWNANMNPDFSDLRFTLGDGTTLVDYWVEQFVASSSAIVWVEVPNIPASGSTNLYMYYGNSGASSLSNGANTWIFFDGGSNGWTNQSAGGSAELNTSAFGFPTNRRRSGNDPRGGWKPLGATVSDFRLLARDQRTNNSGWDRYGLENNAENGYGMRRRAGTNNNGAFGYERRTGGTPSNANQTTLSQPRNNWYIVELTRHGSGNLRAALHQDDHSLIGAVTGVDNTHTSFTRFSMRGGPNYYLDWVAVGNFVQNEPTVAIGFEADNCSFVTRVAGIVFEDIFADGLPGAQTVGDANNPGRNNVRVRLYRDGGDMNPNGGDDLLIQTVTTTATGSFSATGLLAGNYWVTVDSRDLSPTAGFAAGGQGDVWAEQTYGPRGSYCADDGGLRGASTLATADYCFAGRTATGSDNANNLASAEHLTSIALVDSVVNLNFGFSFNVVTNTEDDDDDGANRTQQGGFRQFIQNANALSGGNTMRFVPVEATNTSGSGGNWWNIALTSSLPSLQNPGTEIDGFAYRYDNLSPRNSNGGVTGNSGAPVGTGPDGVVGTGDEVVLPNYERPELEINGTDRNPVFDFVGSNQRVSNLGVYNTGATAFYVGGGTGQVISNNLIGTRADGTDPGGGLRVGQGVRTYNSEVSILQNRLAYLESTGIFVLDAALIEENDLFDIARNNTVGDGITVENTTGQAISVLGNRVEQVAAYGIESWQAQGPFAFRDNTVIRSGLQGGQGETGGIRVFGSGSTVTQNISAQNVGAGIVIPRRSNGTVSQRNLVSRNSLFENGGLGLDIDQTTLSGNPNGDGVSPNDGVTVAGQQNIGLDYPVFTLATYFNGDLHLEGYVGTQSSPLSGSFTIELFIAEDDGNNNGEVEAGDGQNEPHGEPKTYFHTFTTAPDGTFVQDFAAPAWVGLPTGQLIAASARDALNNTSEFSSLRVIVLGAPDITILKTSQAIYDPVNESTNPKAIPGATVLYALNLINDGFGATDSSTVTIIDPLPSEVALVVEDIAGVGSGPVAFMDGFVSSGLNFSFTNFADTTDSVDFSNDGGFTFGYAPSAGPDGTDPAVTHLRIRPEGVFLKSNGVSDPEFEVRFQVKVR